jgi:hypothetical protein
MTTVTVRRHAASLHAADETQIDGRLLEKLTVVSVVHLFRRRNTYKTTIDDDSDGDDTSLTTH